MHAALDLAATLRLGVQLGAEEGRAFEINSHVEKTITPPSAPYVLS
jgi:CRISPR/Cas system CMR-associated protein Cmr3 (group 5 of RAMP superfamily)